MPFRQVRDERYNRGGRGEEDRVGRSDPGGLWRLSEGSAKRDRWGDEPSWGMRERKWAGREGVSRLSSMAAGSTDS